MTRHNRRTKRLHKSRIKTPSVRANVQLPPNFQLIFAESDPFSPSIQVSGLRCNIFPKHLLNQYLICLNRQAKQHEDFKRVTSERIRVFGGENDEDDGDNLCWKMMEYFNGLDYINNEH